MISTFTNCLTTFFFFSLGQLIDPTSNLSYTWPLSPSHNLQKFTWWPSHNQVSNQYIFNKSAIVLVLLHAGMISTMMCLFAGVRLYFTTCPFNTNRCRPYMLSMVHVRMPPGYSASASPQRPTGVHAAYYGKGEP